MPVIGRSIDEIEVGQTAVFTRSFGEDEVRAFADLTWDHNPFHCHPGFAAKGRFGRPIVHGVLVAAAFTHFGGDLFPGPAILATRAEMDFKRPVYPGETITFTAKVTEVDKKTGRIVYETRGVNGKGEEVVWVVCHGLPTAIEAEAAETGAKEE
jgi:3-hydroxybutyryl-CoA dehydratase